MDSRATGRTGLGEEGAAEATCDVEGSSSPSLASANLPGTSGVRVLRIAAEGTARDAARVDERSEDDITSYLNRSTNEC